MKSLTQHIKADGSSLIPLEEKLRIGKDWKPEEVYDIVEIFDDNYKNSYSDPDGWPSFLMDNENNNENFKKLTNVITNIGTKIRPFEIIDILEGYGAVVGWFNYDGDAWGDSMPSGDLVKFAATTPASDMAVLIQIKDRFGCVRARTEFIHTAYKLVANCDNWYQIDLDDFKILLENIFDKAGDFGRKSLRNLLDNWNKK